MQTKEIETETLTQGKFGDQFITELQNIDGQLLSKLDESKLKNPTFILAVHGSWESEPRFVTLVWVTMYPKPFQ